MPSRFPRRLLPLYVCGLLAGCVPDAPPIAPVPSGQPATAQPTPTAALPEATTAPASDEVVTITFGLPDYDFKRVEPLIQNFEAANPDIRVQLVDTLPILRTEGQNNTPYLLDQKLMSAADTLRWSVNPATIPEGLVADLRPYADADPAFQPEDFHPGMLAASSRGQQLLMVPHRLWFTLGAVNLDLAEAAGATLPAAPTMEEVLAFGEKLGNTSNPNKPIYGAVTWSLPAIMATDLLAKAAGPAVYTMDDATLLDLPAAPAVLE